MTEHVIKSIRSHWDKQTKILWFNVAFTDGYTGQVGVPLAHVVATLDYHMGELGIDFGPELGDDESVDGLFSKIKKAVKKVGKTVTTAVSRTARTLDKGVGAAAKVVRDKKLGTVMQVARFVPVVGQTAYAAHQTAKRALEGYEKAKIAAAQIKATGKASVTLLRDVARGKNIQASIGRLKQSANTPETRMLLQALQSMP